MSKFIKIVLTFGIALILLILFRLNVHAMTIVLDTGHGASDPGAINGNITESYITHKIGDYLKEYLEQYKDVKVIMTNTGEDEVILFERAMIARKNNADLLVSLHINSSTVNAEGAEIYVTANTSLPKYNKECTELANSILKYLGELGIKNRGVKLKLIPTDYTDVYSDGTRADYMGIIRYAMRGTMIDWGKVTVMENGKKVEVPESTSAKVENGEGIQSILVEHCFIQGPDYKFLSTDEAIKKLAEADCKGIVEHYGLIKKEQDGKVETDNSEKQENTEIKKDSEKKIITVSPTISLEDLNKFLGAKEISIVDSAGKATEKIATGSKMTINKEEFAIIKMGDVDGDGKIKAADALKVLKHSMDITNLEGDFLKAADVTKDNKIKAADALAILKCSMGITKISL